MEKRDIMMVVIGFALLFAGLSAFGQTTTLNKMVPDSTLLNVLNSSDGPVTLAVEGRYEYSVGSTMGYYASFSLFEYSIFERDAKKIQEFLKQVRVDTSHEWKVSFVLTSFDKDSMGVMQLAIHGKNYYRVEKFSWEKQKKFATHYYTELYYYNKNEPDQKFEQYARLLSNNQLEQRVTDYEDGKTKVRIDTLTGWKAEIVRFK